MSEPLWKKGAMFASKYRIDEVIGRGGMGVVLAARQLPRDEPVAIKVLLPGHLGNAGVVERFLREARAVAKIKSEHVPRVLDVDRLRSGLPFFVMERLYGVDLAQLGKQKGPLAVEEAVRYVVEACAAVAEAHARGIVHRDIKPSNLFLAQLRDGSSVIKVLDFGISKLPLDEEEQSVTDAGVALGSPSYMSPEQMRSARDVDARTDIWGLGAVLYRLLTGKTPFRADSLAQLVSLVSGATLQPPSELRPDIPPGLEAVLMRCLEKDREDRYPTATDLALALLPYAAPDTDLPPPPPSVASRMLSSLPPGPMLDFDGVRAAPGCDRTAPTAPDARECHDSGDPVPPTANTMASAPDDASQSGAHTTRGWRRAYRIATFGVALAISASVAASRVVVGSSEPRAGAGVPSAAVPLASALAPQPGAEPRDPVSDADAGAPVASASRPPLPPSKWAAKANLVADAPLGAGRK